MAWHKTIGASSPMQRYRAVAVFSSSREGLLCFGDTKQDIELHLDKTFFDLYTEEERRNITSIKLQYWQGTDERGYWDDEKSLPLPQKVSAGITTRAG